MDMTLDEALTDVKIAFLQVEFSIKFLSYCELEKISLAEFDTEQIVLLEHDNLRIPPGNFRTLKDVIPRSKRNRCIGSRRFCVDTRQGLGSCRHPPQSSIRRWKGQAAHARVYGAMRVRPWPG